VSRHERFVAKEVEIRGVETFLPTTTEVHVWSDRRKKVEVPLFPGYLFIRANLSPAIHRAVLFARGVVDFIAMGGEPIPIPAEQIANIQRLLATNSRCMGHPFLKIGERVRIRGGALDGVEGILSRVDGGTRLVVSIDGINRSLAMRLEGYELEAVTND
jgi:transcription antitermination factor NusG